MNPPAFRRPNFDTLTKVERIAVVLRMMGGTEADARRALEDARWDVAAALDWMRRKSVCR